MSNNIWFLWRAITVSSFMVLQNDGNGSQALTVVRNAYRYSLDGHTLHVTRNT